MHVVSAISYLIGCQHDWACISMLCFLFNFMRLRSGRTFASKSSEEIALRAIADSFSLEMSFSK